MENLIYSLSCKGSDHMVKNTENQDIVYSKTNGDYTVISLADGAGSCAEAKTGAAVACEAISSLLAEKGDWFFRFDYKKISELVMEHVLYELRKTAEEHNKAAEDYSSTVSSVVYDRRRNRILCFNLGDGMIIGTKNGGCKILSMPFENDDSCCVTTTKNAVDAASVRIMTADDVDSVIVCSDGAWKQFFSRCRMTRQIKNVLIRQDYDALEGLLRGKSCADDYSFIAMDLRSA